MGAGKSKAASCPFTELLQAKRDRAKSRRFTEGEASTFYFLCKDGETDDVRHILEAEDCPSIDELNKLQPNGSTPLHAAAYYNHPDIVQLLLERDCPRTEFNQFGSTAYEEAKTDEMKQLFNRCDSSNRFHETNATDAMALYVPAQNIESTNTGTTPDYVHVFKTQSEIFEYSLNQQTTAMWLKFYNWFAHTFRTFVDRENVHIDAFDLNNHPDFKQFLKRSLSEPNIGKTMDSVNESKRRNSIEPLITLYTSEVAGFYRPLNQLLAQSPANANISPHLCDRFIIEFHIRRHELKQRAFVGTVYRGATMHVDDLVVYKHALESEPPGVLGLKTFTSTSRDPLVALRFASGNLSTEGQKHVLFVFDIMEATSSIFGVDDISIYGHEQEVLILPGNLFTVKKVEEELNPPITKIYLQHLKTSISFWKKIKQTIRAGRTPVLEESGVRS
jgi:hypothetical protein